MNRLTATEALARLRDGNRQFVDAVAQGNSLTVAARSEDLARPQTPFAIILGCSDARVPAELVFHQGLGELFVIRVAGNVVAPSQIGSVEFAASQFGVRLVVVLGHTKCGAVDATLKSLREDDGSMSRNIRSIVSRIRPAVASLLEVGDCLPENRLMQAAVRANVRASVAHLRAGSPVIEDLIRDEGLMIAGAEYDLETGVVNFLDQD